MIYEKAHKELLSGKKIRRKEWEPLMHLRLVDKEVKTFRGEHTSFYENANILITNSWKVIGGDGKYISFLEAINELKNKKCITRLDWEENKQDIFIFIDNGQFAMCKEVQFDFMPTYKCLCSDDWEIMK